ncbi:ABC transporter ATP-binding protein [Microvirga antarctica]|uniref:ABC transporter ATP-binding protein n=1 Tax=Microvirga antarctica TaxID=2819233 RepID=UPI001B308D45|nr:ABC transporter ATP-binding protein [Microvirga antarctica]
MTPILEVNDLTVTMKRPFRTLTALDRVTLTIGKGEVLGLVGESGAGKSLTGAAIVNLLVPPLRQTGGSIALAGRRIDTLSRDDMRKVRGREIGFIFQDPSTSLNPVLSIGHQLIETMMTHLPIGRDEARRRAIAWIDRIGIPEAERRLDQYPHEFSGGMRQRIVIALALCAEPSLVIADEPTTALDVSVQARVLQLLKDLHGETGVAMLLITHDLGVIAKMADRVAVLYTGRVVEIGPTSAILNSPHHHYTHGLMKATPTPNMQTQRLDAIPGSMPNLAAIPSGCSFHPRCPRSDATCRDHLPRLSGVESGFACWHPLSAGGTS